MLRPLLEEENRLMLYLDYLTPGVAGKGGVGCSGGVAVPPHAAESGGGKMDSNIKIRVLNEKLIFCTQHF